jgi:asparagine synthase (glutamine-hydrolysing)
MCGIAGFWGPNWRGAFTEVARKMGDAIRHRGPDDHGEWVDPVTGLALAHRRLSIIDLSREGHQPMVSHSGRYIISFNGEIFNFEEVRAELPGVPWRGHSDTEVMLAAFDKWGIRCAVERFVGMFAFAVWDRQEGKLYLVRDRLGIKPLYYGHSGGVLLFGSELKALRAHPAFDSQINRGAIMLLMRHNYVPHPHCIYEGIYKLAPGSILRLCSGSDLGKPEQYWSAREIAEQGVANPLSDDPESAVEKLHDILKAAVRLRMIADVPLGAFLSGGIDSSTVVALMQAQTSRPVRTFSIGFGESGYDEAPFAARVAQHLGTDHTELYVTSREAQEVVPYLSGYYDEPFSDSSQIPTVLVSRLARRNVTVVLSGDGGDELFAGYPRYAMAERLWKQMNRVPRWMSSSAARGLEFFSAETWQMILARAGGWLPEAIRSRRPAEQVERLSSLLSSTSQDCFYRTLVSHWNHPERVVVGGAEPPTSFTDRNKQARLDRFADRMMFLDLISYLPDDILTKVDRASMSVGLEARVPLLDHRVVEFAWSLPFNLKWRDSQEKWALRQILYKYVPRTLVDRPKMGFGIPVGEWLRGPLRDWGEQLLDPVRLGTDGIFSVAVVRDTWNEHVAGRRNWQYQLWDILMFQAWLEHTRRCP